jgi:PAS domain S-box-containing protein
MVASILVVDDEPDIRTILSQSFEIEGYEVITAADGREAIDKFQARPTDLVVTDMRMPKADGLDVLRAVKAHAPLTEVIVLTGYAALKNAIAALKNEGAFHYLIKPLEDIEELLTTARNALERQNLRRQNQTLLDRLREKNQALRAETITAKAAQADLENALNQYTSLVNAIPSGVLELSIEGVIHYANPSGQVIFGLQPDTLAGHTIYDFLPDAKQRAELRTYIEEQTASDRTALPFVTTFQAVDGRNLDVQVDWNYRKGPDAEVTGFVAVVTDITFQNRANKERLELGKRLAKAQKKEAISTLAGGIAHRFNNSLAVVVGNLELLEMVSEGDAKFKSYIDRIKEQTEEMALQTQKLLAYAQGGKYRAKHLNLGAFIEEGLPIIRYGLETEHEIKLTIEAANIGIKVDPTQLELVLSALVQNAAEATGADGCISITVAIAPAAPNDIENLPPGPCAYLRIEDNGHGMDEETLERLFEPYFSTKFEGRGLGMAAVQGIIDNHNGGIKVVSGAGKGTTVSVYLPLAEAPKAVAAPLPQLETMAGFNLLIIEDEPALLRACEAMLTDLGCRVWCAPNASSGIDQLQTYQADIDLVLMDLILPDMGAMALFKALREIRPDVRVVLCSGYSIDGPAQAIIDAGALSFLQKPYSTRALITSLTRALATDLSGELRAEIKGDAEA